MKKILIAAIALMFIAIPAQAEHFGSTNSYHPEDGKCLDTDLEVWSSDGTTVISCIPGADVSRAMANSTQTPDLIQVRRGAVLMTTLGFEDTCPLWFPMDCVIEPSLFSHWINQ